MSLPFGPQRTSSRPVRLAYLVSHPIQYQAPLLRRIAQEPDIDLTVFFGSDHSVRGYKDEGFGVDVKWDVPLLEGYRSVFLPKLRDNNTVSPLSPISRGIVRHLRPRPNSAGFDALWVHGYASANAIHGILAAKALGIPVLLRAESWLRDRGRSGLKLALKHLFFSDLRHLVSAVLPIGTVNAQYWQHYFGREVPQFLVPYAVDNEFFATRARQAAPNRASLQAELALDPGRPVVLFASKLQPRKHCDHLIAAFKKAYASIQPAPYLVIVGDGSQRAALEQQAATSGLSPSIRFCGFRNQSELPRFFDLATVFVLPSRHEPWGLIVNEVMNAARPAIVSDDVGCAPDLIQDGIAGAIFPAGNVDALAGAVRDILAPAGRAELMGRNAASRIAQWGFEQDIQGLRRALAHVAPGFEV
ncbi:MAG: glycosyltransferase family 4 protein [Actinobacteria bacterium]|nr:glycosyltransferase family 4 protein [Actinomycetota bacterium]